MNIQELIQQLEDAASELGKDAEVRIAYQQNYPLRGTVDRVTIPETADPYGEGERAVGQEDDGKMVWIAVGSAPYGENPYGPDWAWTGEFPEDEDEDACPACGSGPPGGQHGPCNVCSEEEK